MSVLLASSGGESGGVFVAWSGESGGVFVAWSSCCRTSFTQCHVDLHLQHSILLIVEVVYARVVCNKTASC